MRAFAVMKLNITPSQASCEHTTYWAYINNCVKTIHSNKFMFASIFIGTPLVSYMMLNTFPFPVLTVTDITTSFGGFSLSDERGSLLKHVGTFAGVFAGSRYSRAGGGVRG